MGRILKNILRIMFKLLRIWYNFKKGMGKRRSLYNEAKATQVAALLLKLNGGEMDYVKCIKLLYAIEREAINRWLYPILGDNLCSLPSGQVVSQTVDRAEYRVHSPKSFWNEYLKTTRDNIIHIIKECSSGKLSKAEIKLITEIYEENKHKTPGQLFDEHHDPALFPEYQDPHGSSIPTKYSDLLVALGKTQEQIQEFEENISELASMRAIVG